MALFLGNPVAHAQNLPLTPATKEALSELSTGMELETLAGGFLVVAPSTTMLGETKLDPNFGLKLSRQIAVYAPVVGGGFKQVVAVRHDSSDRAFALKVARLAGRLLRLHKDKVGQDADWKEFRVDQEWIRFRDGTEKDGKIVDKVDVINMKPVN